VICSGVSNDLNFLIVWDVHCLVLEREGLEDANDSRGGWPEGKTDIEFI
jgi:hypothetical protein